MRKRCAVNVVAAWIEFAARLWQESFCPGYRYDDTIATHVSPKGGQSCQRKTAIHSLLLTF